MACVGGDLLNCLAATDRLHGNPGLEHGTMSTAFGHGWGPFQGGALPQRLTMEAVQRTQTTSVCRRVSGVERQVGRHIVAQGA